MIYLKEFILLILFLFIFFLPLFRAISSYLSICWWFQARHINQFILAEQIKPSKHLKCSINASFTSDFRRKRKTRTVFYFPFEVFFSNWYHTKEIEFFPSVKNQRNKKVSKKRRRRMFYLLIGLPRKTHLTVSASSSCWWKGIKNGNRRNLSIWIKKKRILFEREKKKRWGHNSEIKQTNNEWRS